MLGAEAREPAGSADAAGAVEKAELARQARALGMALRKGKRVLFASRRHPAS